MRPAVGQCACGRESSPEQCGQALVESLVAMLGLAVLWGALQWLAHYQDINLSAIHASRHAAFLATRTGADQPRPDLADGFFTGSAHRWTDRRSQAVLDAQTPVTVSWRRLQALSAPAQPGGGLAPSVVLRRDWSLGDSGILQAWVAPRFAPGAVDGEEAATNGRLKLHVFDHSYPPLARSIGILTGAGHAPSDGEVQHRVAASGLAWAAAHSSSRLAGESVHVRADGVDAGWNRHGPSFDWLQPWRGRVPGHLITDYAPAHQGGN